MAKFIAGQLVWTRGVNEKIADDEEFTRFVFTSIRRHIRGDWGDLDQEDIQENELSLRKGFRLLSSYKYRNEKIWIITEADRSATTVLFPDEY